jgi:hypothetical protein
MGARLFEFMVFACNSEKGIYLPGGPDKDGNMQKPFIFTVDELPVKISRDQILWGAQASLSARRINSGSLPGLF